MNALVVAAAMKIAVLQLTASNVDKALVDTLSEVLLASVHERGPRYAPIGKADIEAMVGFETQRQLLGCDAETSCLAELGGALGVEKLVAGSVGRIDDEYVLTLRIIDIRKGRVDAMSTDVVSGKSSQLIAAIRKAVPPLFAKIEGTQPAPPPAVVAETPPADPSPAPVEPAPELPAAALEPTPPAPSASSGGSSLVGWLGAGAGAIGAGVGIVGFLSRQSAIDRYDHAIVATDATDARSSAERAQMLFVGGLATAGLGAAVSALGFAVLSD